MDQIVDHEGDPPVTWNGGGGAKHAVLQPEWTTPCRSRMRERPPPSTVRRKRDLVQSGSRCGSSCKGQRPPSSTVRRKQDLLQCGSNCGLDERFVHVRSLGLAQQPETAWELRTRSWPDFRYSLPTTDDGYETGTDQGLEHDLRSADQL